MTKFKPDAKMEKKEKGYQKEGNKAYIAHEQKEVAVAKKNAKSKGGKKGGKAMPKGCK